MNEQDCYEELFEIVNITRRISEFIWHEFQTVGPATAKKTDARTS